MDNIILASQSPRRKQLLEAAEIPFRVVVADIDETPPVGMAAADVPEHLARQKAAVIARREPQATIIAADTIVLLEGDMLGKPADADEAVRILTRLQGRPHDVVTGVCLWAPGSVQSFSVVTTVYFRPLTPAQIAHYVSRYQPFDKAGAYAIQEWIGMVGIEKIDGDYYNVMGLPVGEVVRRLQSVGMPAV